MNNFQVTNQAVEDCAENNNSNYQSILSFAKLWVQKQMKPFTSDDMKKAYYSEGNAPPRQPSVFGCVFRILSKDGFIKDTEKFRKTEFKKAHHRPLRIWISFQYSEKQSKNRKNDHETLNIFNQ